LRRDAERLDLPVPPRIEIETLFLETARRAFGSRDGIIRVEWSCAPGGKLELIATPRELGVEKTSWRANTGETIHPGPEARHNTKHVEVDAYLLGREEALAHQVDEILLFDAAGTLVEGSASNCLVVNALGRLVTPARSLGTVEGLGLTIVRENRSDISEAKLKMGDLLAARELMATNGVRGVVSIVELDGEKIGNGETGPWAKRLRRIFFRE
jgi:branched-subunit amino acid aminotransferase/4-amino-4-deoxychorismate lyase